MSKQKVALVTGGTGGIGKEVARGLLKRGMSVVIVGRTVEKGEQTVNELGQSTGNSAIKFIAADLSLMQEVKRAAAEFRANHQRLDILVHSAGGMHLKFEKTAEGIESNIASSYLHRFLLTELLLDLLRENAPSRIITIAGSRGKGKLDLALFRNPTYGGLRAHGQAQAANDQWTLELARRIEGSGVEIAALNPGAVDTDIRREFPGWMTAIMKLIFGRQSQTPAEGAVLPLWLATAAEDIHGKLFKTPQSELEVSPDFDRLGAQLWEESQRLSQEYLLRN